MFGWISGKKKGKAKRTPKPSKAAKPKSSAKTAKTKHLKTTSGHYINWKAKKEATLKRDNYRCRMCGATSRLHIHHESYEPERLITLCKDCHNKVHGFA